MTQIEFDFERPISGERSGGPSVDDARAAFIKPIGCTVATDGPPDLFSDSFYPVAGIFSPARDSATSDDGVEWVAQRLELDLCGCLDARL